MNKWDIILKNYNDNLEQKEEIIQKQWESMFADSCLFGYSNYLNEIVSHRVRQIGSTERIIPDIIIKDSNLNKDLFVIELKQYTLKVNESFKSQLQSYMILFGIKIGIIVCNNIYVYYLDKKNDLVGTIIEFTKDESFGEEFVNLFCKGNFNENKTIDFINKKNQFINNIKTIKDNLTSDFIKNTIKEYLSKEYCELEIEKALQNITFQIQQETNKNESGEYIRNIRNAKSKERIQDYVKRLFTYLLKNNLLSEKEITMLHDFSYSKKTFGIEYALLCDKKSEIYDKQGTPRYWKSWKLEEYYMCSQWWLQKEKEYTNKIYIWLSRIVPDYLQLGLGRK